MPLYHMAYTIHYAVENRDDCEQVRTQFLQRLQNIFTVFNTLDTTFYIKSAYNNAYQTIDRIKEAFNDICHERQLCDKCKLEVDLCLVDDNSLTNHQNFPRHLMDNAISKWPIFDNLDRWQ